MKQVEFDWMVVGIFLVGAEGAVCWATGMLFDLVPFGVFGSGAMVISMLLLLTVYMGVWLGILEVKK